VKIGGVSENTLSNIIYRIRVLQELKNWAEEFIISHIFLGGRKGKGWRVQLSLDIGGLYIPLGGLSLHHLSF
jgi:hypothetical protein